MSHLSNVTSQWFGWLTSQTRRARLVWFGLSLAIAALYGGLALQQAFAGEYVVQDDARQHIFWMQRFIDPDLFPNDLIADYFQGVAPLGYRWLYQGVAALGISPILSSKILPFFLGLITASYSYWITISLFSIPVAGFISSVSLSQSIWYSSEHASATPRAFLYPLLLAFIYYCVRENSLLILLSLVLLALFYPQISLVCLGVLLLRLLSHQEGKWQLAKNPSLYGQFLIGFFLIAGILLYAQSQADFGEVVSRAEAIALPEFQSGGRNSFFTSGLDFWLTGRSGLFHERGFTPATLIAGFLLPVLIWLPIKDPFRRLLSPKIKILLQVLIVSLGLFLLAHLLLFRLHLPSRYTSHTFRALLGITCGISWVMILADLAKLIVANGRKYFALGSDKNPALLPAKEQSIFAGLSVFLLLFVGLYPAIFFDSFPKVGYYNFSDRHKLYEFFSAQPKDSVIASLSVEASNIPMFSARTVLVSPEHAIAYHKGYYGQFRQRVNDLLQAQYSTEPEPLLKANSAYGVDFWLLDSNAFQPSYIHNHGWLRQYQPAANAAIAQLESGQQPILQQAIPLCALTKDERWVILDAYCVNNFAKKRDKYIPKSS